MQSPVDAGSVVLVGRNPVDVKEKETAVLGICILWAGCEADMMCGGLLDWHGVH